MFFALFSLVFSDDFKVCISVDSGTSSTRLYVYAWNTSYQFPVPAILNSTRVKKSLNTAYFDENIVKDIFDTLLETAYYTIGNYSHNQVDFFVYFTSIRNLPVGEQAIILKRVYDYVKENTDFQIEEDNLDVIDPIEEGIYTWITVNILTQKIGTKGETYPVASMGTSTTSLVFDFEDNKDTKYEPYKYTVSINNFNHTVFCMSNSHLGIDSGLANHTRSLAAKEGRATITTPCYLKDYNSVIGDIDISGGSSMDDCNANLSQYTLVRKDSTSSSPYDSFDYFVLPNRIEKPLFATAVFAYAATAFDWNVSSMTLQDEIDFAKEFCSLTEAEAEAKYLHAKNYINVYCAQMTYTNNYLSKGFGVPLDKNIYRIETFPLQGSREDIPLDYLYGTVLSRAYGTGLVIKEAKKKFSTVVAVIISVIVGVIVVGVIVFIIVKIRKKKQEKDEEGGIRLQEQLKRNNSSLENIHDPNEPILSI